MKTNQINRGHERRLLYFENKSAQIDGEWARIGYGEFSKSGKSIYYRGRELRKIKRGGFSGNYLDIATNEEYWVSGVKKLGNNSHRCYPLDPTVDEDALEDYKLTRGE